MMKKIKIAAILLFCAILFSLFAPVTSAASASISMSLSAMNVTLGNHVTVIVCISSNDEPIGSWLYSLNYDPAYLDYVSGADSGGGGAVTFSDSPSSPSNTITHTVIFATKKIGTTTVSVNNPQIVGFNSMTNMGVGSASRTINVISAPTLSGDNSLATMAISPGELTPAFQNNTTSYTASVPFEVTELAVSATTSHAGARVAVSSTELSVGENTITVTVTAQNGRTKTYTITVTRQESDLAGVTVNVGGSDYTVAHDPTNLPVPEGFTVSTSKIGDKKILSWTSPKNSVTIVYLISEEFSGFFVYNEEQVQFQKLETLTGEAATFIILNPTDKVSVPAGFLPKDITVGEKQVCAYQNKILGETIYLVYAMAPDGTLGFYYYDDAVHSFVSYFDGPAGSISAGASTGGMSEAELRSELEKEKQIADRLEILVLALGIVLVLMAIGMILIFVFRRRSLAYENQEESWEKRENSANTLLMNDTAQEKGEAVFEETKEEKNEEPNEEKHSPFGDGSLKF